MTASPSPGLAEQFARDGYIVLSDTIDRDALSRLRAAAAAIVDEFDIAANQTVFTTDDRDAGRDDYFFDSAEAVHCFLEAGALDAAGELTRDKSLAINKIGHAMHDLDPVFTDFCRQPVFGQVLREIGYVRPLLYQSMYIFKQPGIGGEVRWHQDASYLMAEGRGVTGIWVALEDASQENGCLWVQPGQHRSPLRERYLVDWESRRGALETLSDEPWNGEDYGIPVEVSAGSVIVFSDRMPHYSSTNTSARSRHAFTLHVAEREDKWLAENWLQRPNLPPFEL
ncbi:MAG: phytanoyl-CoA dioxygenase family protein [Pseudomonadota bacterium]